MSPNVIMLDDFNIHIDDPSSVFAKDFTSLLDCLDISQYVNFPTHNKGHILVLICCTGITPCNPADAVFPIFEHKVVIFEAYAPLSKVKEKRTITFKTSNASTPQISPPSLTPTPAHPHPPPLLTWRDTTMVVSSLNALAPLKTRTVSFAHTTPWYTTDVCQLKITGR